MAAPLAARQAPASLLQATPPAVASPLQATPPVLAARRSATSGATPPSVTRPPASQTVAAALPASVPPATQRVAPPSRATRRVAASRVATEPVATQSLEAEKDQGGFPLLKKPRTAAWRTLAITVLALAVPATALGAGSGPAQPATSASTRAGAAPPRAAHVRLGRSVLPVRERLREPRRFPARASRAARSRRSGLFARARGWPLRPAYATRGGCVPGGPRPASGRRRGSAHVGRAQ